MSKPLVVSCGGGIVSALVAFTAHLLEKEVPVYDVRFYSEVAILLLQEEGLNIEAVVYQ